MDSTVLLDIFNQYPNISLFISLCISILIALFGILPSIFVTAANIIFFGPFLGFLISLLGETLGGYISFKLYRLGFKKFFSNKLNKYTLLNKITSASGYKCGFYIFEGRLLPFVPSGFVTFAASISNVNSLTFTIATALGKIPSIAIEAIVSYDLIHISENWSRLLLVIIAIIIAIVVNSIVSKKNT